MKGSLPVHDTARHNTAAYCASILLVTLITAGLCASAVYLLGVTHETSSANAFSLVVLITFTSRSIGDECTELRGSFKDAEDAEDAEVAEVATPLREYHPAQVRVQQQTEHVARAEALLGPPSQQSQDAGLFQRLCLFLVRSSNAFVAYIGSFWNTVDFASLVLIVITVSRVLTHAHRGPTTQVAAFATALLWLRMINYLSGFEKTAPCELLSTRLLQPCSHTMHSLRNNVLFPSCLVFLPSLSWNIPCSARMFRTGVSQLSNSTVVGCSRCADDDSSDLGNGHIPDHAADPGGWQCVHDAAALRAVTAG
eukprot:COSAG03_NODE_48_length_16512_cov_10.183818_2_plen_310_part_00